jgi:signal transduction histidine kinase
LTPVPGLGDLESLVDQFSSAGLAVSLSISGSVDDLPADLGLSAYRIVQQALTNTLSHGGPGAAARVELTRADDELRIDITDEGRAQPVAGDAQRTGRGLIGMRERAMLFGGELVAGPRPEGGFAVRARIPLGADQ